VIESWVQSKVAISTPPAPTYNSTRSGRSRSASQMVLPAAGPKQQSTALSHIAFDLLAIDDFATDTLTEGQRNALADSVRRSSTICLRLSAWRNART